MAEAEIPAELQAIRQLSLETVLPESQVLEVDPSLPTLIYNYYNLDPNWHPNEKANRILLLEPAFFEAYPVSARCVDFMLRLADNIPGIQVFNGSIDALLTHYQLRDIYYKEHPFNRHYPGKEEPRAWISEELTDYYPSFFAYWKKLEKMINQRQ